MTSDFFVECFKTQLLPAWKTPHIIVIDNDICHKSSTLKIPSNIGFTFILPYTPEMNPIEQV